MKLFFDLDGTLLDAKPRLYLLFQHLVPQSTLTFEAYWKLKQNKINHQQILSSMFQFSKDGFMTFEKQWMELIEEEEWLKIDQPIPLVLEKLGELKSQHQIFIVTARQYNTSTIRQLTKLGFGNLIDEVLVTEQKKEKDELIRALEPSDKDWIIGDTGKDILTGKTLGIRTAAVTSGFLSKDHLLKYQPDIITETINELNFQ